MPRLRRLAIVFAALPVLATFQAVPERTVSAQELAPNRRAFTVLAKDGRFEPDRLEALRNDLVTITFRSEGAPHSFAIDAYRLMKRAAAGQTITFEFRADQVGRFTYYCSLSSDEQCRDMKGTLIVTER